MTRTLNGALSLTLLAVFAAAFVVVIELPPRARPFPIFVLSAGSLLCLLELLSTLLRGNTGAEADTGLDLKANDGLDLVGALVAGRAIIAWILSLVFSVWLVGATLAVPLWLLAFLLAFAKLRWWRALLTTTGFVVLTIALFDLLLSTPWPQSAIPGVQSRVQDVLLQIGI